ncbi:hypothetical protein CPB84DRAFT_1331388 [Gymnopilus junonius]|uniref:Uncharacterized protein n=1 Tax=Gymnopilus junonius TaxID=109634 RepID=A0A9P5NKE6_GYMJU|nr:hypothetical protein CPB84DRAFT_1331388 [Gymnopilus junonius]
MKEISAEIRPVLDEDNQTAQLHAWAKKHGIKVTYFTMSRGRKLTIVTTKIADKWLFSRALEKFSSTQRCIDQLIRFARSDFSFQLFNRSCEIVPLDPRTFSSESDIIIIRPTDAEWKAIALELGVEETRLSAAFVRPLAKRFKWRKSVIH